jgi:hypothetical protein
MGGTFSRYGGEERCIRGFGGRYEGKRPIGRPSRGQEDNITTSLQEGKVGGGGGMSWTGFIWLWIGTGGGLL